LDRQTGCLAGRHARGVAAGLVCRACL